MINCKAAAKYHSYILTGKGIKRDPEKIRATVDMSVPADAKGMPPFNGVNEHQNETVNSALAAEGPGF